MTRQLKRMPGLRKGGGAWQGADKHLYHINKRLQCKRLYLVCAKLKKTQCRGAASVRIDGKQFRVTKRHNHDPDDMTVEGRKFRGLLMEACRSGDRRPLRLIYGDVRRKNK